MRSALSSLKGPLLLATWGACTAAEHPTPSVAVSGDVTVHELRLAGDGLGSFAPRKAGRFGLERLRFVSNTEATGPRGFLRVTYPRGSTSPTDDGAPGGGAQFLGQGPLPPADHLFLRYRVRFAPAFPFVKGGKLPGLYGGTQISGGRIPDGTDGFSTRFMWREDGAGELYIYLPGKGPSAGPLDPPRTSAVGPSPPALTRPSSQTWGTSLGRGSFHFQPGRWHCLEQEVSLNTPGRADGAVRVWLDERPVFQTDTLVLRTVPALRIEGVFFSTFFGGHDASWAPPADTYADFADFAVGSGHIGCG